MTTLVIETRITGTPDREDRDTMLDVISKEEDNGSGKTRLMARFATGATQQLAIEP